MPDSIRAEVFYANLKNRINAESPVISQFLTNRVINMDNERIWINIIRQINAKLGGDLWRMSFNENISPHSIVFGIDVCHKGHQSVVGFVSSYDRYLCKYFTQAQPQREKGKEIVDSDILQAYFENAFKVY